MESIQGFVELEYDLVPVCRRFPLGGVDFSKGAEEVIAKNADSLARADDLAPPHA